MTLQRRTPLRAQPRGKGNRFERDVVDILRAWGWTGARRNWQSGGQGGGDIIGGPPDVHLECKHHERCRIWDWIAQAESEAYSTDIPVVVLKRNRSVPWAILPTGDFKTLRELHPDRDSWTVMREGLALSIWSLFDQAVEDAARVSAQTLPIVEFRRPGGPSYTAVRFEELLALVKLREAA